MTKAPIDWQDLLQKDEEILWQGQPYTSVVLRKRHILPAIVGLIMIALGIISIYKSLQDGNYLWLAGLVFAAIGVLALIAPPVISAIFLRNTWYTLSNKRAFIATNRPDIGRDLNIYLIDPNFRISFDGKDPASITFGKEFRSQDLDKNHPMGPSNHRVNISFERIPNGQKVYQAMLDIQKERT